MDKNEIEERIEEIQSELSELEETIENFELDPDDFEDQYCNELDELNTIQIGTLEYSASHVLREIDPTAYRCGLNDYVDGLDKEESEDYKKLIEQKEDLENELENLKEDLEEIEEE